MAYTDSQLKSHVSEIQSYLKEISAFDSRIPLINVDGIYDEETENAVKSFQTAYNLSVTGEVDHTTWDYIINAYKKYYGNLPEPINIFPSNYTVKANSSKYLIYIIQLMLELFSESFTNIPKININGKYDEDTQKAVIKVQELSGLKPTGEVNTETWNVLVNEFNNNLQP